MFIGVFRVFRLLGISNARLSKDTYLLRKNGEEKGRGLSYRRPRRIPCRIPYWRPCQGTLSDTGGGEQRRKKAIESATQMGDAPLPTKGWPGGRSELLRHGLLMAAMRKGTSFRNSHLADRVARDRSNQSTDRAALLLDLPMGSTITLLSTPLELSARARSRLRPCTRESSRRCGFRELRKMSIKIVIMSRYFRMTYPMRHTIHPESWEGDFLG